MRCPPWHFLPGPYEDDPERTECPHRDSHAEQRSVYEATQEVTTRLTKLALDRDARKD